MITTKKPEPGARYEGAAVGDDEREHLRSGFGAMLRRERLAAGYSRARLAELSGLWERTVGRYERGEVRPRADALEVLALILRRPEGPDLADRRGRSVKMPRDSSAADTLRDELLELVGDSIRPRWSGRGGRRAEAIRSLRTTGLTRLEIEENATARVMRQAERQLSRLAADLDSPAARLARSMGLKVADFDR